MCCLILKKELPFKCKLCYIETSPLAPLASHSGRNRKPSRSWRANVISHCRRSRSRAFVYIQNRWVNSKPCSFQQQQAELPCHALAGRDYLLCLLAQAPLEGAAPRDCSVTRAPAVTEPSHEMHLQLGHSWSRAWHTPQPGLSDTRNWSDTLLNSSYLWLINSATD